ncbi:MAG: outer membrane beta-barrel protein [Bacteroidetes bacterium]|nr:outer membrane beta-barrel protein [Bacteroidota bacterium]
MQINRFTILLFLIFGGIAGVDAQVAKEYSDVVERAGLLYDQGKLQECLTLCRTVNLDSADVGAQWKVNRLMAIVFLANQQNDSAKKYAEKMLDINPTYTPSYLKDPTDLIKLLGTIEVIPKFSLGGAVSLGSTTTFPIIKTGYVISDYTKTYQSKNSFQFGLSGEYLLKSKLGLNLSLLASQKSFQINYDFDNWKNQAQEKLTYIDLPVAVSYYLRSNRKVKVYFQGGIFGGCLLFSNNNFTSEYLPDHSISEYHGLDATNRRYRLNFGMVGGAGVSILGKKKKGHVFLQASYFHSFAPLVKSDTRYKYSELLYSHFYVDDDFKLDNLSVCIGYSFHLNYKVLR